MTDTETVYMTRSGQSRAYHVTPDCPYLPTDPAAWREVERCAVESHYDPCKVCGGE